MSTEIFQLKSLVQLKSLYITWAYFRNEMLFCL